MIERRAPNEKMLQHDADTIEAAAGGPIDFALVLGSGLSPAVGPGFTLAAAIPYDRLLGIPIAALEGHAAEALVGVWHGKRALVFAGRVHLYQGFSAQQVTVNVRLAQAAGATTVLLTNASGAVDPAFEPGDLMLLSDHINLTGRDPVSGAQGDLFVDLCDAYSPRLRALARQAAKPTHRLREGVYAGIAGPSFETPAEAAYLRAIGAQAVGMSTVLETMCARSLGAEVLAIGVLANRAGTKTTHAEITARAGSSAPRLGELLDAVVQGL